MPASEKRVVIRSPVEAEWLMIAVLLASLIIDLVPRFYLGDSHEYLFTRWGGNLPVERSWTYGLVLGWVTRGTGQLLAMPLLQIFLSWAAFAFFAITLTKALGLRRRMALLIVAIGCLEPLGYYWSRAFMPDSLAQSAFVFLCGVLLLRSHLAVRFLVVFIVGFMLLSLGVVYFPAILLALLATTAWSAWNARKQASHAEAGVSLTFHRHSARSWGVAAAALLCANLTYGAVNTLATHAHRLTTNMGGTQFLVAVLSPVGADQLDSTPLTRAERSALIPLTYENRVATRFAPNGLVALIGGHYPSTEAARPAMQRFVANVVIHHPFGAAGLVARQWGDYLNPVRVWSYQRKGLWSGAVAYAQPNNLTESDIQLFKDWKVWPTPTADLPSRNSPSLWYFKRFGGIWALALSLYATFSFLAMFLIPRVYRRDLLVFSSVFPTLYMAEIALSSVDMLTRFLLPISAPMICMVFVLAKFGVDAPVARAWQAVIGRWREASRHSARRRTQHEASANLLDRSPDAAGGDKGVARRGSVIAALLPVIYGGLLVLTLWGITRQGGFWPLHWNGSLALDALGWGGAAVVAALATRLLAPARPNSLLAAGVACYLAIGVGWAPSLATVSVGLFAWLVGKGALRLAFGREASEAGVVKPLMVGLAFTIGLFGILLHVPVNTQALYVAIIGLPIAGVVLWRGRRIWTGLRSQGRALADAIDGLPPVAFVLAVVVVGYVARLAFFPSVMFDDNAFHLRMWTELSYRHFFPFDVTQQVWEAAPFASDLLHATTSLLASADARGALNLILFALLLSQVWAVAKQLRLAQADLLLVLVLVASTPLAGYLLTTLQVELFLALLATAGVNLIIRARPETYRCDLTALLAVVALCCATKLPGIVLGACLVVGALIKGAIVIRDQQPGRPFASPWPLALFIVPVAFVALQSYVVAWRLTGNPVFPLYNGVFKSRFYPPVNFADLRWVGPVSPFRYVRAFFATSQYLESQDFTAGFQYLFLAPLALAAIWRRAPLAVAASVCLVVMGFGGVMFAQTQYWRYMFPVMPLAAVAIGALLPSIGATSPAGVAARIAAVACIGLNLLFYPGISWTFGIGPQQAYTAAGKQNLLEFYNPVAALAVKLGQQHPGARVLFPPGAPSGARLFGDPIAPNDRSPDAAARFLAMRSPADVEAFLKKERVSHVVRYLETVPAAGSPEDLLGAYLSEHWVPEEQVGSAISYALPETMPAYRPVFDLRGAMTGAAGQLDLTPDVKAKIVTPAGVTASQDYRLIAHVDANRARIMRYKVEFRCSSATGSFIAEIYWDHGPAYNRLVPCAGRVVRFQESALIPDHARSGDIFIAVQGADRALVSDLQVEVN